MSMICPHDFIRINDATKPRPTAGGETPVSWNGMIAGAVVGCVRCGQIRTVFEDGTVKIASEGGKPIDEDHDGASSS